MKTDLWIAFCYFHLAEYKTALELYQQILESDDKDLNKNEIQVYIGCCQFYLGMYSEAKQSALKSSEKSTLLNRLMFHLCHKFSEESELIQHHQQLQVLTHLWYSYSNGLIQDTIEDQLCLASIHYLRSHFQEAIDVYKKILLDKREYIALNVYVALCYYKLDYYDVSQEVLAVYLQQFSDSVTATNLKACNHYRLYNGKAAEVRNSNFDSNFELTYFWL